jgi:hypothetical protein
MSSTVIRTLCNSASHDTLVGVVKFSVSQTSGQEPVVDLKYIVRTSVLQEKSRVARIRYDTVRDMGRADNVPGVPLAIQESSGVVTSHRSIFLSYQEFFL